MLTRLEHLGELLAFLSRDVLSSGKAMREPLVGHQSSKRI
jgi:hypothetical protein